MNLASIGSTLAVVSVVSFILNYFEYELKVLAWIDAWGRTNGIMIRIGLLVLGLLLMYLGRNSDNAEEAS